MQQFPEVKMTLSGLFKKEICLFYVLNLAHNSHWIFFFLMDFTMLILLFSLMEHVEPQVTVSTAHP